MSVHGSLLHDKERGYTLTVFCDEQPPGENPCGHSAVADWDALIARFGPDFIIPRAYGEFIAGLRCGKCGGKRLSLSLRPPAEAVAGDRQPHVW